MQLETPQITRQTLEEFGIDVSDQDVDSLLAHLNETLLERIGAEVTEYLSDEQLEELVELQATKPEDEIAMWLSNTVDTIDEIAQDEIDIIIGELAEKSDELTEAS